MTLTDDPDRVVLTDDGTLDTVILCRCCGAEGRYNYTESFDDAETRGEADLPIAIVSGYSRVNGMPRDAGHYAYYAEEILTIAASFHPDDRVHVRAVDPDAARARDYAAFVAWAIEDFTNDHDCADAREETDHDRD